MTDLSESKRRLAEYADQLQSEYIAEDHDDVGWLQVIADLRAVLAAVPECDDQYLLSRWFTAEDEESAKSIIGDCPREILQMVAILVNLDITTRDHAAELAAEGWVFKVEEAEARANRYRDSINALVAAWGQPEIEDEEDD